MTSSADHPGVVGRPPLLYLAALIVTLVARWLRPLPILGRDFAPWLGLAVGLLGIALGIWGRRTMTAAGTNVDPALPTTTIVTSGPFRFSRNPLYLALTLLFLGLTVALDTWWGVAVLLPLLLVMHFGVVLREERYLEQKFGDGYRQYRSAVRRYL